MTRIQVQAGTTLLQGFIRTPAAGLCELVWNAFDEDARVVTIAADFDEMQALASITVTDNGNGMNFETASREFARVGDSWKIVPGTKSDGGRPVHGRHGRGRYSTFSIGSHVRWESTAKSFEDETFLQAIKIIGTRDDLEYFDITKEKVIGDQTETIVTITGITTEARKAFDRRDVLIARLTSEFSLHLDRFPDFKIKFLGEDIDPASVIETKEEIPLPTPAGVDGDVSMTIIEWKLPSVERRIYLCDSQGTVKDEAMAKVQAPGTQFTAYLKWDGFAENNLILELEGEGDEDSGTPAQRIVDLARETLRKHLGELARRREAATVQRWKTEGIYPYKTEAASAVEKATQDTFEVVAMAASRTVDESKSQRTKALALGLLKEAFESDPDSLFPLLAKVTSLPAARIDELKRILQRTSLSQLIQAGHKIGNRVDFLHGLNEILFERASKKRLLERRQLHRILAHETWIFGEEWSLTGDDERLREVLKKFLRHLGQEVELTDGDLHEILREDGRAAIPDLVLGRKLETKENYFQYLVVELKRPKHRLTDEDVTQLRSYASAITKR